MSSSPGSITYMYQQAQEGDDAAAGELYKRFVDRLLKKAETRLYDRTKTVKSPFDAVNSAFMGMLRKSREGGLHVESRDDIIAQLLHITELKCRNLNRQRKGESEVKVIGTIGNENDANSPVEYQAAGNEYDPQLEAETIETYQAFLAKLPDKVIKVLELKMQRCKNKEIADKLGMGLSTVERHITDYRLVLKELMSNE